MTAPQPPAPPGLHPASLSALLLLAVALAVPLGTGPAAAQGIGPDLAATSLAVAGPMPGWTEGVGNSTTIKATVANLGTSPAMYRIAYAWVDPQGVETPLNGADESSFDVSRQPLQGGASRVHEAPWRLQPGQEGNGSLRVRIAIDGAAPSDPDPSNDARTLPVFVASRGVELTVVDRPAVAEPGAPGFFRLGVRNLGNAPVAVALRIAQAPADRRLHAELDPPSLVVAARSQANATLYVAFDAAGDFSPFNATYVVEADAGYMPRPTVRTPWVANGSADATLDGYAFNLSRPASDAVAAFPGLWTNATLLVANDGSRPDSYALGVATSDGSWSAAMVPARVALFPGESMPVTLRLRPPLSAPAGSAMEARVSATARLLPTAATVSVPAFIPGAQTTIESLALEDPVPYVGDTPTALVTLVNHGEETSREGGLLRVSVTPAGSPAMHVEAFVPALAPGERAIQAIELPLLTRGGAIMVVATLRSVEGATPPPAAASAFVHDGLLEAMPPDPLTGSPGETVAYRVLPTAFRLVNSGNTVETLDVTVASTLGEASADMSEVTLAPGQTRIVGVRHTLPAAPNGTTVSLTLTASLSHRSDRSWSAEVATVIVDREGPRLSFPMGMPAEWDLGAPLQVVLAADDAGGPAVPTLEVVDADGGRLAIALQDLGGGLWRGEATLATAGNHSFLAAAQDPSGNAANLTRVVRAGEIEPPHLELASAMAEAVGANETLRVLVQDARAVPMLMVEVNQGTTTLRRQVPVVDGVAEFDLEGAAPGPADLVLVATNAAGGTTTLTLHIVVAAPPDDSPAPAGKEAGGPVLAAALALALALALRRRPGARP